MKTIKKKKVTSRHQQINSAIETMKKAVRQFEETGYAITAEDVGPIYVAYCPYENNLHIAARDMESGWGLSFDNFAKQLIENLTSNDFDHDEMANCSMLLVSGLRKAANDIELRIKKLLK